MSLYAALTPASLVVPYTATPGVVNGYSTSTQPGQTLYGLIMSTDAWFAQGIDDTAITSQSATADTLSATGHKLISGMPIQVSALLDVALSKAWQVQAAGPTFVDETTAANNATANDVQPFPTGGGVSGDYFAVGYTTTFGQIKVVLGTAGSVGTLVWEYWNGTAWTALAGVVDNTTQFKAIAGTYTVTYTTPADWAPLALNGGAALYYIRAKVTATYTINPLLTQVFIEGVLPTGLSASTTYWAIVVDANTFKLALSRAAALAGTAIDLTSNGGGVTATTVATKAAGSMFVPAKTLVYIDGNAGAKISVIQDAAGGNASFSPLFPVR